MLRDRAATEEEAGGILGMDAPYGCEAAAKGAAFQDAGGGALAPRGGTPGPKSSAASAA